MNFCDFLRLSENFYTSSLFRSRRGVFDAANGWDGDGPQEEHVYHSKILMTLSENYPGGALRYNGSMAEGK